MTEDMEALYSTGDWARRTDDQDAVTISRAEYALLCRAYESYKALQISLLEVIRACQNGDEPFFQFLAAWLQDIRMQRSMSTGGNDDDSKAAETRTVSQDIGGDGGVRGSAS